MDLACFLVVLGSNKDVNVLNQLTDVLEGEASNVNVMVNGHEYNQEYYLVDDTYPWRSMFVKITSLHRPRSSGY
jgi:hypothetical protein